MNNYLRYIISALLAGAVLTALSCAFHNNSRTQEAKCSGIVTKMEQTQENLIFLVNATIVYGNFYPMDPIADWACRDAKRRDEVYNNYRGQSSHVKMASQMLTAEWNSHFDALKINGLYYAEKHDKFVKYVGPFWDELNTAVLSGEAFLDPFGPEDGEPWLLNYYNTYGWNYGTFFWISVGPDGRPDIFPFVQRQDGVYLDREGKEITDPDVILETGNLAVSNGKTINGKSLSYWDCIFGATVDTNLIYDPTNGMMSNGDIVVGYNVPQEEHYSNINYMFSPSGNPNIFLKKNDLTQIFQTSTFSND